MELNRDNKVASHTKSKLKADWKNSCHKIDSMIRLYLTLYGKKILPVLLVALVAQPIVFSLLKGGYYQRYVGIAFYIGLLLSVFLMLEAKGNLSLNTVKRLNLRDISIFSAQWTACSLILLVYWLSQAASITFSYLYIIKPVNQQMAMEFYGSNILHAVMPMESIAGWIINIFYVILFGGLLANVSFRAYRGRSYIFSAFLIGALAVCFPRTLEETNLYKLVPTFAICILYLVVMIKDTCESQDIYTEEEEARALSIQRRLERKKP